MADGLLSSRPLVPITCHPVVGVGVLCLALVSCDRGAASGTTGSRQGVGHAASLSSVAQEIVRMACRSEPRREGNVVHVATGVTGRDEAEVLRLLTTRDALVRALGVSFEAEGVVVARNLAPKVDATGDDQVTWQPEQLEPAPQWVLYVALSSGDDRPHRAQVTSLPLTYATYQQRGVSGSSAASLRLDLELP